MTFLEDVSVGPPKPHSCSNCPGWNWGRKGFMAAPEGPGMAWNGVLLVGEALDAPEAAAGKPYVGKAGLKLSQMLQRGGFNREHFAIDSTLRCQPPDFKLSQQPYMWPAVQACAPHLEATITRHRPKVIVPMGDVALRRILGVSSFGKGDSLAKRRGFVERLDRYGAWMVPTFNREFLRMGNGHLTEVFLSDVGRAVAIASGGYTPHIGDYISDPSMETAEAWVSDVERRVRNGEDISLAVDIETPYKNDAEDEGVLDMDDPTFTILRVGFAFHGRGALSLAWLPQFIPLIRRLLALSCRKLTWNGRYDMPRLRANGMQINGEEWDLMWAWHILHSSLPKGLGFVASLLLPDVQRWKHLSNSEAGKYNALDAEITWRLEHEIISRLKKTDLWPSYYRHIVQLDKILLPMGERGVPVDRAHQEVLAKDITVSYEAQLAAAIAVVPREARRKKLYRTKPKISSPDVIIEQHERIVKVCSICGVASPTKPHFRVFKRKENPCALGAPVERKIVADTYVKYLPWVPSNKQMTSYLTLNKHTPVKAKGRDKEGITFNEEAVKVLMRRYPEDLLYPKIVDLRELETLGSRYAGWWVNERIEGGVPVGKDGYVHPTFLHNPSTLRLACQAPNMQNIPRPSKVNPWPGRVKGMFVAPPGELLFEIDYSAIEAVLVGYFARSARYMRLAKMGVHDYLNAHILAQTGKVLQSDIPDLAWSDADLKAALKVFKGKFPEEREVSKRIVHGGNYLMTPRRMWELYPKEFPTLKLAAQLQNIYFEVCPEVRAWQQQTIAVADNGAALRNPYGYIHHFFHVKEWFKHDGKWEWKIGEDAKSAVAFGPQSTAAAIIKEAMLRIDLAGLAHYLRLQVHDSLLGSAHRDAVLWVIREISKRMTEPVDFLPLSVVGQEGFLAIEVEAKVGERWSEMTEVK